MYNDTSTPANSAKSTWRQSLINGKRTQPFIYGRPVRPDEFFNRESSLRSVFNRLRNDESTAVVGEPHIGKSSLLLKLEDHATQGDYLGQDAGGMVVTSIDLHPISNAYTPAQFWEDALFDLEDGPGDENVARILARVSERGYQRRDLERLFKYMGRGDYQLVLLLDEFERLLYHPNFRNNPSFFALLRSLSTRTGGLIVIPASRLSVADMNDRSRGLLETGSPFFNNIIEEKLNPFDERAMAELLDQAGDTLSDEDHQLIGLVAGHHPFLVQAMAASLVEESDGQERHRQAVSRFYRRISYHFDDLWHTLDDRTRSAAVILSLMGLGGRTLGLDFADERIDADTFIPELEKLFGMGLARPLHMPQANAWLSPVEMRGQKWTIGAQSFAWWVRDVLVTGTRRVPLVEDWLEQGRYQTLLEPDRWHWLLRTVKTVSQMSSPRPDAHHTSLQLHDILIEHFNEAELRELCFSLDIEFEVLGGRSHKERVIELVMLGKRHGRLDEILAACLEARPFLRRSHPEH